MGNKTASLYEKILDQTNAIYTPARNVALRDGLVLTLVRAVVGKHGLPDTIAGVHDTAASIYLLADALMAERGSRQTGDLAAVESWAKDESEHGMLLYTHGEILAARLLHKFGGSIEFPIAELVEVQQDGSTLHMEEDERRGVVAFTLKGPKDA